MFNFIKVAAVSVALTMGVVHVSQAQDLCQSSAEVLVYIADLRDRGASPEVLLYFMVDSGYPTELARQMVIAVYGQPTRTGPAIATDFYLVCVGEQA